MDLEKIQSPEFLKNLSVSEMIQLAAEIRSFLIHNISKTGGHLASNLGVVELTLALHYVFDSPTDKIFFDVGHQCYTHKILTGRASHFATLRQYKGISGFQKRAESVHDVWEAGHSSTSLSAALGMAVARDLNQEDFYIVPVIGDGALGSGMALEALNQIGSEKKRIIIIFNDNNMSISKNVGALTKGFARLRSGTGYNNFKTNMKAVLKQSEVGRAVYSGLKNVKDTLKESVIDTGIFGEFNLDYLGPVDGHNIRDLIRVMKVAKQHDRPVVVHVITQKGRGYSPCERDIAGYWHGVSPFHIEDGTPIHTVPEGFNTWSGIVAGIVEEMAAENDDIIAMTPAMMTGSGLDHFFARFPERSFDCGIAEEHTVTFAASLALSGKRPFVSIYSSFLQRAYDQVNHDVCRMDLPVVFGIDRAGLVGSDGDTHHGVFDIGILRPLPNLIIAQPKDSREAADLLYTAFHQKHPFAIRYPRGETKKSSAEPKRIEPGTWETLYAPENAVLAVLAYGPDVVSIASKMQVNELPVRVINCRYLKPFDEACIRELSEQKLPVIVYESDMKTGSLSSAILEFCCDSGIALDMTRMGIPDVYVQHGSVNRLRREQNIDLNTLYDMITERLDGKRGL